MSSGSTNHPEIRPMAWISGDEASASVARKTTNPVTTSCVPKRRNGSRPRA